MHSFKLQISKSLDIHRFEHRFSGTSYSGQETLSFQSEDPSRHSLRGALQLWSNDFASNGSLDILQSSGIPGKCFTIAYVRSLLGNLDQQRQMELTPIWLFGEI